MMCVCVPEINCFRLVMLPLNGIQAAEKTRKSSDFAVERLATLRRVIGPRVVLSLREFQGE